MKLNFKERKKQAKGITLIALVITIIVLLILAGVAIATLTGDNGILNQAGKAKDKTTEAETIERVKVEVAGSYGTDGKIDVGQVNKNLKNINGLTYNGSALSDSNKIADLPATVTLDGYKICINKNGETIKIPEGVSNLAVEIAMNPQAYYGKKVTNYKDDGNTYRIFYVDKDNYFKDGEYTIYLKADFSSVIDSYCLSRGSYDATNTKIRTMNPLWAAQRGSNEDNWWQRERVAAVLCSPVKGDNYTTTSSLPWNGYYKINDTNVNYVIGGPSVEMYVKSYNQTHGENALGCQYQTNGTQGYGYKVNGTIQNSGYYTDEDTLDYSMKYDSMYCGKDGVKTGEWWLASPSARPGNYGVDTGCCVNGEYGRLSTILVESWCSHNISVSPLVSLKPSFVPQVEE